MPALLTTISGLMSFSFKVSNKFSIDCLSERSSCIPKPSPDNSDKIPSITLTPSSEVAVPITGNPLEENNFSML